MRLQLIVLDDVTSQEAIEVLRGCGVGSVELMSTAALDESTATCEACGCRWENACIDDYGECCAWDPYAWAQGHAICTHCVFPRADGKAAPAQPKPRKGKPAESRPASVRVLDAEGRPIPGASCNFDVKWSPLGEPPPTKPPGAITIERPTAVKDDRSAEIERRLRAGETVAAVAKAVGLTHSAIYQRRKKLSLAPAKRAKRTAKKPWFRCKSCSHMGKDPARCEHCFERRQ